MPTTPVTNWGEALLTSLASGLVVLFAAVPRIIGFLAILIIGWIIAAAMAGAVTAILRTVKFNDVARRSGFSGFVENMGIRKDASAFIADLVKWFVRLIVLVSAFDALGLPAVSQVLQQLLLWLPNLVVALVILVLAGLAANALAGLVRGATAESGLGNPEPAGDGRAGRGVGLCHRGGRQPDRHRHHPGQHPVHGPGRRAGAGARPGLRTRWSRHSRPDRRRLVPQGRAGGAQTRTGRRVRSADDRRQDRRRDEAVIDKERNVEETHHGASACARPQVFRPHSEPGTCSRCSIASRWFAAELLSTGALRDGVQSWRCLEYGPGERTESSGSVSAAEQFARPRPTRPASYCRPRSVAHVSPSSKRLTGMIREGYPTDNAAQQTPEQEDPAAPAADAAIESEEQQPEGGLLENLVRKALG